MDEIVANPIDTDVGALLRVQATAIGARRILEIGTAIGGSGVWLARALPHGGMLITMELDAKRAEEARRHFARAGVGDRASVMVGDASRMLHKVSGPFDLIFQDGDRQLYVPLLDTLIGLLRPGGLLITAGVPAHAACHEALASDPRLLTTWLPLGDGVAISVKVTSSTSWGQTP